MRKHQDVVEDTLIKAPQFHLPGKKELRQGTLKVVVMDVTETPIERPKRRQRRFYSGKKKRHTLKSQLIIDAETGGIVCIFFGPGRQHDFKVFQASGIHFHPHTKSLVDKGYQGIQKLHGNSEVPQKKPQGGQLSQTAKAYNRALAKERIGIEGVTVPAGGEVYARDLPFPSNPHSFLAPSLFSLQFCGYFGIEAHR